MTCNNELCLTEDGKSKFPVSIFIERQLPRWAAIDHPKFIRFLEAYYEWLETTGTGEVINFEIEDGGKNYSNTDPITIKSSSGQGFTGTLQTQNGVITSINITTAGSNYKDGVLDIDSPTGYGAKIIPIFSKDGHYASKYCLKDNLDVDRTVDEFLEFFKREYLQNIPRDLYSANKCESATPFTTVEGQSTYSFDLNIPKNADISVTIDGIEVNYSEYTIGEVTNICSNSQNLRFSENVVNSVGFANSSVVVTACENIKVNERLLIKTIKELNVQKGTEASYKFLFNILFNEDIEIKYPNQNLLIASDGKWQRGSDINITNTFEFTINDVTDRDYSLGIRFDIEPSKPRLTMKPNNQINLLGTWNAETNTPTLEHGTGNNGDSYLVSVGGLQNLDPVTPISGETLLFIEGDQIVYSAAANRWIRVGSNDFKLSEEVVDGNLVNSLHIDSEIPVNVGDRFVLNAQRKRLTGGFANEDGKLSSTMLLQDGKKYQQFSYVIRSERTLDQYADYVKRLLHPAGLEMFGEIALEECISFMIQDFWYTRVIQPISVNADNNYSDAPVPQLGPRWRSFDMHKFEYGLSSEEFMGLSNGWLNTQIFNYGNQVIGEIIDEPEKKINYLIDARLVNGSMTEILFDGDAVEFVSVTVGLQDLGQFVYDLVDADITPFSLPTVATIYEPTQLVRVYPSVYNKQDFVIDYHSQEVQRLNTLFCDETQVLTAQDISDGYVQFGLDANGTANAADLNFGQKSSGAYGDATVITPSIPVSEGIDFQVDIENNRINLLFPNGATTWVDIGANFQKFVDAPPENIGLASASFVSCALQDGSGDIIIAGSFDTIGSQSGFGGIAKWNVATNTWSRLGWGVNVNEYANVGIYGMDFDTSGNIYVVGNFNYARGASIANSVPNTGRIAKYNVGLGQWQALNDITLVSSATQIKYSSYYNGFIVTSNVAAKSSNVNILADVGTVNERWCTFSGEPLGIFWSCKRFAIDSANRIYSASDSNISTHIKRFTPSAPLVYPNATAAGTWDDIGYKIGTGWDIEYDSLNDDMYIYNSNQHGVEAETLVVTGGQIVLSKNPLSPTLNTVVSVRRSTGTFLTGYSVDYPNHKLVVTNPLEIPDGITVIVYYKRNGDDSRYQKYDVGTGIWSAVGTEPALLNSLAQYGANEIRLKINPVTNELYVTGQSSTINTPNVWKWDGFSWTSVGLITNWALDVFFDNTGLPYVCGQFESNFNEPNVRKFGYWDGNYWRSLSGIVSVTPTIFAVDIDSSDNVYVAGDFTHINNVPFNNIAMYDGIAWNALDEGVDNIVNALRIDSSDNVYIAGKFNKIGSASVVSYGAAMWNGAWNALGGGLGFTSATPGNPSCDVYDLAIDGTDVYFAGAFNYAFNGIPPYASVATDNMARWNGAAWVSCGGTGGVATRAVRRRGASDIVFATRAGAIYSSDGTLSTLEIPAATFDLPNPVYCLAIDGAGDIYIGGRFDSVDGLFVNNIAKWNGLSWEGLGDGTPDTGGVMGDVYKMEYNSTENMLYVVGNFSAINVDSVDMQWIKGIAKWDIAGSEWFGTGISFYYNNIVYDIEFKTTNKPVAVGKITFDEDSTKTFQSVAELQGTWNVGDSINIQQYRYMYLPNDFQGQARLEVYHSRDYNELVEQTFVATGGEVSVAITIDISTRTPDVYKNGSPLAVNFDYTITGTTLNLTTPLVALDEIVLSYTVTTTVLDKKQMFEPLITNIADEDYERTGNIFDFSYAAVDSTTEYHVVTTQNITDGYIQCDGAPFIPEDSLVGDGSDVLGANAVIVKLGVSTIAYNHASYAWEIEEKTRRLLLTGAGWVNTMPPVGQTLEISYPRIKKGDVITIEYLGAVGYITSPTLTPQNVIDDFDGLQIYYSGRVAGVGFPEDVNTSSPDMAYENLQNLQLVNKTYIPDNRIAILPIAINNLTEHETDAVTYPEVTGYPYHVLSYIVDINQV